MTGNGIARLASGEHRLQVQIEGGREGDHGDRGVHFSLRPGCGGRHSCRGKVQTLRSDLLVGICMARPRPARANGRSGRDHHGALHERMNGTVVGVGTEAAEDVAVGAVLSQGA
jgi:hypothetical protein